MSENIGLENEGIGYKGTHYYLNKDYKLVTIKKVRHNVDGIKLKLYMLLGLRFIRVTLMKIIM